MIRQPRGCSKCGCENPAGNNFCARCGTALGARYAKCCAENSLTSNFCGKRGAALTALIGTPISERATILSREVIGERRHLTVLFCDLVGSTAITAQLDPEEWRDSVAGYHRIAAEAITRFDGHVAKYLGDGVMAYFGWPAAAQAGERIGTVERIRESLAEFDAQRFYLARAAFLRLLGETQMIIGAIDDALVSAELDTVESVKCFRTGVVWVVSHPPNSRMY